MPTTRLAVQAAWSAAARITASGDTAIEITNTTSYALMYVITDSDTTPVTDVSESHRIHPERVTRSSKNMTLKDGERLWLAFVTVPGTITYTSGAA